MSILPNQPIQFVHFESDELMEFVMHQSSGYSGSPEDLLMALEEMADLGELSELEILQFMADHNL